MRALFAAAKHRQSDGVLVEGEALARFHEEERARYDAPGEPFFYTAVDGKQVAVAPLFGSSQRARPHNMLKDDRPGSVTFAAVVRDACARLPGGSGLKADVVYLVKTSQWFTDKEVTDGQVSVTVGGGLERLSTREKADPCVAYDEENKRWLYLHVDRKAGDFRSKAGDFRTAVAAPKGRVKGKGAKADAGLSSTGPAGDAEDDDGGGFGALRLRALPPAMAPREPSLRASELRCPAHFAPVLKADALRENSQNAPLSTRAQPPSLAVARCGDARLKSACATFVCESVTLRACTLSSTIGARARDSAVYFQRHIADFSPSCPSGRASHRRRAWSQA